MINLIIIMGAGQDMEDDLLGFRPFANKMVEKYGVNFVAYAHDEDDLKEKIELLEGTKIIIGFSNGGHTLWNLDQDYKFESAIFLDPFPDWSSVWNFIKWCNPFYKYPTPINAVEWICFYNYGKCFKDTADNNPLNIEHEEFPSNNIVLKHIEGTIVEWK